MSQAALDALDRKILDALPADGRASNVDLSAKVHLSAPQCFRRVRSLEDRGVITEITEELDSYEIKSTNASLGRGETPAESLLADHSSDDELHQIVLASRLRPNP